MTLCYRVFQVAYEIVFVKVEGTRCMEQLGNLSHNTDVFRNVVGGHHVYFWAPTCGAVGLTSMKLCLGSSRNMVF